MRAQEGVRRVVRASRVAIGALGKNRTCDARIRSASGGVMARAVVCRVGNAEAVETLVVVSVGFGL